DGSAEEPLTPDTAEEPLTPDTAEEPLAPETAEEPLTHDAEARPMPPAPEIPTPGVGERPTPPALRVARPIGTNVLKAGLALVVAFAVLAAGASWWQVVDAQRLSSRTDNPSVIAAQRRTLRGPIVDRNGNWLAKSVRDQNGEAQRQYRDKTISPVVGYASRQFGTAGLERAYNAQLLGLTSGDPVTGLVSKLFPQSNQVLGLKLSLDLRLQQAAVAGLGSDKGAVVMLDPSTGEILAMASTPTYDANGIADPDTAAATMAALQNDKNLPLLPRATLGQYVPGSVLKIVTAIAGLNTGAITPATTYPQQPKAEKTGLLVDGFRIKDGHHPQTGNTALDFTQATEVSCNIWYALTGLAIGGDRLVSEAAKLGFGQPLPFDLPTSPSRLTNGDGSAPGGFADDAELASAAFGQGEAVVTPLQMALVASTVADDGWLMKPHLVTALTGSSPGARTIAPETWRRVLSAEDADAIKVAMEQAVEGDLGKLYTTGAAVPGVPTAGKSGTAQLGGSGEPHSWFIGFAPVDHPKVAIAVLVEQGGRGGERAAPLAGSLLKQYFALYGTP
ncbi:MAG TPA: penicillin-binding transpeptidase domain-containing protein, partial [Candidatus Limnocylindrales bacterium]